MSIKASLPGTETSSERDLSSKSAGSGESVSDRIEGDTDYLWCTGNICAYARCRPSALVRIGSSIRGSKSEGERNDSLALWSLSSCSRAINSFSIPNVDTAPPVRGDIQTSAGEIGEIGEIGENGLSAENEGVVTVPFRSQLVSKSAPGWDLLFGVSNMWWVEQLVSAMEKE